MQAPVPPQPMPSDKQPSTSEGWDKWHDFNAVATEPVTQWVLASCGLRSGQHVLDIASGTGLPALALAERVGPHGRVTATDVSDAMLASLERRSQALAQQNLQLRRMDACQLDFPDASFDSVTCAFGLMFAADPVLALSEMRRVLKPAGKAAIAVWAERGDNPLFSTVFDTVAEFVPSPPQARGRGMFSLGGPDALETALLAAGFSAPKLVRLPLDYHFDSAEQHFEMFSDMAPPVKLAATTLPADALERLKARLRQAIEPHRTGHQYRLRATALCASATGGQARVGDRQS